MDNQEPRFGVSPDPSAKSVRRFVRNTHDADGRFIAGDKPDINSGRAPTEVHVLHLLGSTPMTFYELLEEQAAHPEIADPCINQWPPSECETAFALGWLLAHGLVRAVE